MKFLLLLAGAWALTASPVFAQTVVPGAEPEARPVIPTGVTDAGSPRAHRRAQKVPNLDRQEKKMMRKMGKVNSTPEGMPKMKRN